MPTLNLGRVRFNWRDQYDPLVPYKEYDCVEDDGQSYVCIAPVTGTGPNDTGGATYWGSMLIRSADYNQARQDAIDAAVAAGESATAAGTSETNAASSAMAAGNSATKADKWANELEDVEVEPGKFSSFHWKQKAAAFGDPNQFDITADQTLDTRTMAQWAAQTLITEQALDDHEAATDPHSQYYNQARGDLRYVKLSGVNNFDTMPTVGGDPIVESGSNSDGEWTRWADGTQVCRYKGATNNTSDVTWVFPSQFLGNPSLYLSPATGLTGVVSGYFTNTASNTQADFTGYIPSGRQAFSCTLLAIGRWK